MSPLTFFSRLTTFWHSVQRLFRHRRTVEAGVEVNQDKPMTSLTQEEKDYIEDQFIGPPKKELAQAYSRSRLNPVLKDFLSRNRVLIVHVVNKYGFKVGVVVATAKNQIGFSMVSDQDTVWRRVDPMNLPIIRQMRKDGKSLEEVIASKAYQDCVRNSLVVGLPRFDRNIGLLVALGRALECDIGELSDIKQLQLPMDKDLREAAERMIARAKKYFR